jgi:hypothetical protein
MTWLLWLLASATFCAGFLWGSILRDARAQRELDELLETRIRFRGPDGFVQLDSTLRQLLAWNAALRD